MCALRIYTQVCSSLAFPCQDRANQEGFSKNVPCGIWEFWWLVAMVCEDDGALLSRRMSLLDTSSTENAWPICVRRFLRTSAMMRWMGTVWVDHNKEPSKCLLSPPPLAPAVRSSWLWFHVWYDVSRPSSCQVVNRVRKRTMSMRTADDTIVEYQEHPKANDHGWAFLLANSAIIKEIEGKWFYEWISSWTRATFSFRGKNEGADVDARGSQRTGIVGFIWEPRREKKTLFSLLQDFEDQITNMYLGNKSNRTTMRPLGIYLIGISIYILNIIHFLMILGNFGGFF